MRHLKSFLESSQVKFISIDEYKELFGELVDDNITVIVNRLDLNNINYQIYYFSTNGVRNEKGISVPDLHYGITSNDTIIIDCENYNSDEIWTNSVGMAAKRLFKKLVHISPKSDNTIAFYPTAWNREAYYRIELKY